jgi:hypothetical protein
MYLYSVGCTVPASPPWLYSEWRRYTVTVASSHFAWPVDLCRMLYLASCSVQVRSLRCKWESYLFLIKYVYGPIKRWSCPCNKPWRPVVLWDVEFPIFSLDSRLTDGGKIVSLTRRPPFTPRKIPDTHFCQRLSWSQGNGASGRIRLIEKVHFYACSIVPQPTTLQRAPKKSSLNICVP